MPDAFFYRQRPGWALPIDWLYYEGIRLQLQELFCDLDGVGSSALADVV